MSNRTYICTDCRYSKRADASYGLNHDLRCPECQQPLHELEWRWRIPKKNDEKGWKELSKKVHVEKIEWSVARNKIREKKLEKIDRTISSVELHKESDRKTRKLKELNSQRTRIQKSYTEPGSAGNVG